MTQEAEETPMLAVEAARTRPRRELLQRSLGTLGSLLLLEKLSACGEPDHPARPGPVSQQDDAAITPNLWPGPSAHGDGGTTGARPTGSWVDAGGAGSTPADADGGACVRSTTFLPIADDGLRTSARSVTQTDTLDWITIGLSGAIAQTVIPDTLLDLLRQLGELRLGYPINLLDHSLQTATRARRAGASDDLVLAALLHHVGASLSVEGHGEISGAIVRGYVSEDVYQIVRHHAEYAAAHFGALRGEPTDQRARYASQPWHADAARLADEWERLAYDPDYPSLPLSEFEPLLRDRFSLVSSELYATHGDCI